MTSPTEELTVEELDRLLRMRAEDRLKLIGYGFNSPYDNFGSALERLFAAARRGIDREVIQGEVGKEFPCQEAPIPDPSGEVVERLRRIGLKSQLIAAQEQISKLKYANEALCSVIGGGVEADLLAAREQISDLEKRLVANSEHHMRDKHRLREALEQIRAVTDPAAAFPNVTAAFMVARAALKEGGE